MSELTATDLRARGVIAIKEALKGGSEAIVSVRGEGRYAIMELARYQYLRECELEVALNQTRADIAAGRVVLESPKEHLSRLNQMK